MSEQKYDPLTCTQQSSYGKECCPYPAWQLIIAKDILEWAYQQCQNIGTIPMNVCLEHSVDEIERILEKEILNEVRFARLQDYDNDELEYELKRRKEANNDDHHQ